MAIKKKINDAVRLPGPVVPKEYEEKLRYLAGVLGENFWTPTTLVRLFTLMGTDYLGNMVENCGSEGKIDQTALIRSIAESMGYIGDEGLELFLERFGFDLK